MTFGLSTGFTLAAFAALAVSALGLGIATLNYRRKAGIHVRGSFSVASSVDGDDDYISSILLENLKDRAVTIFAVYLRLGHNYYIEILDLAEPLILKAFETHHVQLGPIELYGFNGFRLHLNALFKDKKVKKRLVLSTSDGKYIVPSKVRRWSPIGQFFQNHMTAVLRPVAARYKETSLGSNIVYVLDLTKSDGASEVIPLHKDDTTRKFRNFRLTPEAMGSKDALEAYLEGQRTTGNLVCSELKVIDLAEWRKETTSFYSKDVHATSYNWFEYYVLGRFMTFRSDRQMAKRNAEIAAKRVEAPKKHSGYSDVA